MKKTTKPTFAIFFTNGEAVSIRRFAILRRYLNAEFNAGIKTIDHAYLGFGYFKFLLVVAVDSREILENALETCNGVLEYTIVEVSQIKTNPGPTQKRFVLLASKNRRKTKAFIRNSENLCAKVNLQTHLKFKLVSPFSSVLFVEAPSTSEALQYGEFMYPQANIFVTEAVSPEAFLESITSPPVKTEALESVEVLKASSVNILATSAKDFTILNEGDATVYTAADSINVDGTVMPTQYYDLFKFPQALPSKQSVTSNAGQYIWPSMSGSINFHWLYNYTILYGSHGGGKNVYQDIKTSISTNAPAPMLYSTYISNVELGFNLGQNNGFHTVNAQYLWLNDITQTKKYDANFIEKSYVGDDLNAYNYFIEQLNGIEPLGGTIPSGIMQAIFDKGCPSNITQKAFDEVGSHLVEECTFFELSDKWFGINGIISIVNTQIAVVSTNDLTSAAALMQIQDSQPISTTLDSIFSIFSSITSMIPEVGTFISGAINIGWNMAKLMMGPGETNKAIETTIAKMADELSTYFSNVEKANAANWTTIRGNWGKLKTFADGTMGNPLMISETQFNISYSGEGNLKLPQSYLDAAAKAWKLIIYQSLFAGYCTPICTMTTNGSKPSNPWNPDAGNYEYVFYLDCIYPDSNGNPEQGFMVFDCRTNAPTEVMQLLFGNSSEFNLNPMMFFAGFNGWTSIYVYNQGFVSFLNIPSIYNFSQLGIIQ